MKFNYFKSSIITIILVAFLFVSIPQEANARNLFRQFFHDIKRATSFIVKLPDKATRWMGPVLGPIASGLLTGNLAGHHKFGQLFTNVRRVHGAIEDIEEQKRLTGEVRQMYRDQATELRDYVKKLQDAREHLKSQLTSRDVNMHDYIQTAIELDKMIATVNQTADRFDSNADKIRTQDIVKLAAGNLLNAVVGEIKNAALNELNSEILDVINPDIITLLTDQGSIGLDTLVEMFLNDQKDKYDGKFDLDELRDRVKDRIREILQENKDGLKGNLKDHMNSILSDIIKDMENEKAGVTDKGDKTMEGASETKSEEKKNPYNDDELATTLTEIPKDEFGCKPGYEWQRMSGVGCVQTDCGAAGGHYSYTKRCICGFVNPKPGDKTKSCMRPSNYLACPSCVYACVTSDAECPAR